MRDVEAPGLRRMVATMAKPVSSPDGGGSAHLALAELQALVRQFNDKAAKFVSDYQVNLESTENERVFGEEQILARVALLAQQTINRMDTLGPGIDYPAEHIAAAQKADLELHSRGIKSRVIYLAENLKFPQMLGHFEWAMAHGIAVRTTLELPIRMIISDQKQAILPLDTTDGMNGILIVKDAGTIQALCALFETKWAAAEPFDAPSSEREALLDVKDIQVLHLLGEALTDREIGRRMGFGTRTASYAVETVRRKLGARNRFELGVIAAKEGWL